MSNRCGYSSVNGALPENVMKGFRFKYSLNRSASFEHEIPAATEPKTSVVCVSAARRPSSAAGPSCSTAPQTPQKPPLPKAPQRKMASTPCAPSAPPHPEHLSHSVSVPPPALLSPSTPLPRRTQRHLDRAASYGMESPSPRTTLPATGLRQIYLNFTSYTTLHGLPNASTSPTIKGKVFWSLVFLFCFTCFCSQLYILISKYLRYEKNIELDVQFSALPFPSVTFCSLNPFEKPKAMTIDKIRSLSNAYESAIKAVREHKVLEAAERAAALLATKAPLFRGKKLGKIGDIDVDDFLADFDVRRKRQSLELKKRTKRSKKMAKDRATRGSAVLQMECFHDDSNKFFFPAHQASKRMKETGTRVSCLCVEDEYAFQAYCAPHRFWMLMACPTDSCLPDHFCGRFANTLSRETADASPLAYKRCICNLLADGCYAWEAVNSTEWQQGPRSPDLKPQSPGQGGEKKKDSDFVDISKFETGDNSTSWMRFDYNFVFENMTDEMAVQAIAKETLLYIGSELTKEQKVNMSYSKESLIQMCSYNGEACDMDNDFQLRLDPFYGNCYTYNWDFRKYKNSTRAGAIYGLRVMVQARLDDYLFTTDSAGVRLAIHDHSQEPFPEVFGQSAPNGFMSSFGVKLEKMHHLPAPYGDCANSVSEAYRKEYIFDESYSVEGCYRSCYQHKVLRMCHCGDPRFPVPKHFVTCKSDDVYQRQCLKSASDALGNFNKVTGCICPKPCMEYVFSAVYSGSIWPAKYTKEVTATCDNKSNKTCLAEFKRNSAVVEVFYERLNYQALNEIPAYGFTTLVSDIGGIFGLWMGASVITALEFFALMCEIFAFCGTLTRRKLASLLKGKHPDPPPPYEPPSYTTPANERSGSFSAQKPAPTNAFFMKPAGIMKEL